MNGWEVGFKTVIWIVDQASFFILLFFLKKSKFCHTSQVVIKSLSTFLISRVDDWILCLLASFIQIDYCSFKMYKKLNDRLSDHDSFQSQLAVSQKQVVNHNIWCSVRNCSAFLEAETLPDERLGGQIRDRDLDLGSRARGLRTQQR
jgi:hypothetical protein